MKSSAARALPRSARRPPRASPASLLACLALAACASTTRVPAGVLDALARAESGAPRFERRTATAVLDAPGLSGVFRSALLQERGFAASVRLQLLPEVGGKVLDVAASPERVRGSVPQAGLLVDHVPGEPLPTDPLLFLAGALLEGATPLAPERVRRARRVERGWELELVPALHGLLVTVLVDEDGVALERRYRARRGRFAERLGEPHVLEGERFRLAFEDERVEPLERLPAGVFRAEAPETAR